MACGESSRLGVAGHEQNAGEIRTRGKRAQHILRQRARQLLALMGGKNPGQALLGKPEGLDREDRPRL
jgi:hypothetical protein